MRGTATARAAHHGAAGPAATACRSFPIPLSMNLDTLGPRICILGPSNSGKSTLADAIAAKQGLEPIHLDRLYHLPHTDWQPRPAGEFLTLHDAAIAGERWVMDGNYSSCLPQRLARATGLILLDLSTPLSLWRYARRTWFERDRRGALDGGRDSVKWSMIRHIVVATPPNRKRYAQLYARCELPKVLCPSARALARRYREWGWRASAGRRARGRVTESSPAGDRASRRHQQRGNAPFVLGACQRARDTATLMAPRGRPSAPSTATAVAMSPRYISSSVCA